MPSTAPLAGITVLDFTRVLSGPYCTMLLADMGARVIKIEQPGKGDDTRAWGPPFIGNESAYFLSVNRNKESLTLDLKAPAARQVLARLLDKADVIVENFRPGAMARLGLDYASVAASHPSIVYCSISGFGQTGPRRDEPGYDAVIQAEGGLMSITGEADGPPFRLGVAISDVVSGMFAFQGIAMALFARTTHGPWAACRRGHARGNGGAADLSVRQLLRDWYGAAATGKPSSDDRAVRDVCRERRGLRGGCWKRRVVAHILPGVRTGRARRGSPVRDEPAARDGL